jgi:hypothetical protein
MLMSRKKAGQKYRIKIANRSFKGVTNFKYLEAILTDQHCVMERRLRAD